MLNEIMEMSHDIKRPDYFFKLHREGKDKFPIESLAFSNFNISLLSQYILVLIPHLYDLWIFGHKFGERG